MCPGEAKEKGKGGKKKQGMAKRLLSDNIEIKTNANQIDTHVSICPGMNHCYDKFL